MFKNLILVGLLSTFIFGSQNGAKYLVIENEIFDTIQTLKILDGGIKKDTIIKSTKISTDNMKKYYPEFFIYNAKECVMINDILDNKKMISTKISTINNSDEIKKEIKKIKLLQILVDNGNNVISSHPSKEIIKSLGIICEDKVHFRGKTFKINDSIGKLKIKNIDSKNGILYAK